MPLIKLETTVACEKAQKEKIVKALSKICAKETGKPEKYVMALMQDDSVSAFAGQAKHSAFVEVRGLGGLNAQVNKKLSSEICELLNREIGIKPDSIYINFMSFLPENWGWNGGTF